MNLEIFIDELSLPHGSIASDLNEQITAAIQGHLNRDASKLFTTSNARETIGQRVVNAIENPGFEGSSGPRSLPSVMD
jgi:hypothetical protein